MFCEGQTLPISENEVLFQLIGTTYGGDGEETFNLPNLPSRVPIHMGTGAGRHHLSARRDGRRRAGHADRPADPDPHPSADCVDQRRRNATSPRATCSAQQLAGATLYIDVEPPARR